ncbi:MAG: RlmE family RNA methyltransferase [Alphaproteobacteria bacterium]
MSFRRIPKSHKEKTDNRSSSQRAQAVRVKTAKGRKTSSTRWLQRQLNDPYVQAAHSQGLRSRAAFKIRELNDRFQFLKEGQKIVDLGAAPGGWTQEAVEITQSSMGKGMVLAVDIQEMEEIAGATVICQDFLANDAEERIMSLLDGKVDGVISDMAPFTTGHQSTDHIRIIALVDAAYHFACKILKPNGYFVAKVFQGGTEGTLYADMQKRFTKIRHAKPPSSRKESPEVFVIATGFKG